MCMQDYKIGARVYPLVRTAAADANGLVMIERNANRMGIRLLAGQGTVTISLAIGNGQFAIMGGVSSTGTITGNVELLLKNQGNVTMGPFQLSSTIGAGGVCNWVEYLAENDVMAQIMEDL